jgi:hypothetical protein
MRKLFFIFVVIFLSLIVLNVLVSASGCPPNSVYITPCGDNCCRAGEVCNPTGISDEGIGTCCKSDTPIPCGNVCCPTGYICDSPSESRCLAPNQTYCPHICEEKSSNHACNGPPGYTTLSDDPSNCGSCGNICASDQSCIGSRCFSASSVSSLCPSGQVICVPGYSSVVINPMQSCGGENNTRGCYCAEACNSTIINQTIITENRVNLICGGCLTDTKCLPIGIRLNGTYCSIDDEMLSQKNESESCDNNFECTSNFCSGTCISASLIQKIIAWFKNLFGF